MLSGAAGSLNRLDALTEALSVRRRSQGDDNDRNG
jgi:hypothetical protein